MTPSLHECQHDFLHIRHFLWALGVRTPHVVVRRRVFFVSGNVPLLFAESAMRSKSLELSLFLSNERFGTLHWKKDSLDFFCHLCIFLIFVLSYWCCEVCLLFFVIVHNLHTIRRQSGSCLRTCVFAFLLRRRFWWSNFCDFSKPSCKTMTLHIMILLPGT